MYADGIQLKILKKDPDINYGSIYEKTYTRHHALDNVMNNSHYEIDTGIVLCNDNIHFEGNVWYCPIYLTGFLKKEENFEDMIYSIDLSELQ